MHECEAEIVIFSQNKKYKGDEKYIAKKRVKSKK